MDSLNQLHSNIIVDSAMTFTESIAGSTAPEPVLAVQRLVDVYYYGFDGKLHKGQILVHFSAEQDVKEIFSLIRETHFPLNSVIPIVRYNWSDEASMEANNSSAFNYRFIAGTQKLSNHASGLAVDLNPFQNPVIYETGQIQPTGAAYQPHTPGTLTESSPILQAFLGREWHWGGHFQGFLDYHHFEKTVTT